MNYFIFILFLTILISQDIVLFNEETLVLFSFIGFCIFFKENLGISIQHYLENQSSKIYKDIKFSYISVLDVLKQEIQWNIKKTKLNLYFLKTKEYQLYINFKVLKKLSTLQIIQKRIKFKSKLNFVYELEQQFGKLIILLIITKVYKLVQLNLFYKNILKVSNFICINKIILREYLEIIK